MHKQNENNNSFLFTLVNARNKIEKLELNGKNNQFTVCHKYDYGPIFGGGNDLFIYDNCNTGNSSYSNLGVSYTLPPKNNGKEYLCGGRYFKISDYEVYQINFN